MDVWYLSLAIPWIRETNRRRWCLACRLQNPATWPGNQRHTRDRTQEDSTSRPWRSFQRRGPRGAVHPPSKTHHVGFVSGGRKDRCRSGCATVTGILILGNKRMVKAWHGPDRPVRSFFPPRLHQESRRALKIVKLSGLERTSLLALTKKIPGAVVPSVRALGETGLQFGVDTRHNDRQTPVAPWSCF